MQTVDRLTRLHSQSHAMPSLLFSRAVQQTLHRILNFKDKKDEEK
jgi:hypothetical protein